MTNSRQQQDSDSISGQDVFAEVANVSKKLIGERLVRMIESADDYQDWTLADEDAARLVKLIRHKQRIICSSFAFQLKRHFSEFKSDNHAPAPDGDKAETDEMESISARYEEAFKDFDRSILKRLQACIKRSRAHTYDNPLQIKRMCAHLR